MKNFAVALVLVLSGATVAAQDFAQDFTTEDDGGEAPNRCMLEFKAEVDAAREDERQCYEQAIDACQDITPQCIALLIEVGLIENISGTNPVDALSYLCALKKWARYEAAALRFFWCNGRWL